MTGLPEQRPHAPLQINELHAAVAADTGPFGAAHRKILDLHQSDGRNCSTCYAVPQRELIWDGTDERWTMHTAPLRYPCDTVRALAEAYLAEA
ncbi:hypothetical protein [Catellatospora citrea]|nr:hypothetical protein [Catellatospora citrea]RKE07302.1 hypothetical protein C8E86_2127 [Catellatospora citrea]